MMNDLFQRIEQAHRAIRPQVSVTPLAFSPMLSKVTGCEVYLKCEHLQHTGSFKFRGATNKLRLLDPGAPPHGGRTAPPAATACSLYRAATMAWEWRGRASLQACPSPSMRPHRLRQSSSTPFVRW